MNSMEPSGGARAMDERPKYLALGRIFLAAAGPSNPARIIEEGQEFFSEGVPNNGFRPLNAAARAAKLKAIGMRWRENPHPAQFRRLAVSLGFAGGTTAEAQDFIAGWIAHETQKETTP
jgi:hypothetical protein